VTGPHAKAHRMTRRSALSAFGAAGVIGGWSALAAGSRMTGAAEAAGEGWIDAVETAARVRDGAVTASAAVGAAIARAEALDPKLNAIVTPTFDLARQAAAAKPAGPFAGVPTFVKDLTDVAGQPTGYGSRAFAQYVADSQPPFVDALFATGAVSLGKSATPEFGATATTEPLSDGPTRNPWNTDHSTGGSSGGAAALVAAGVVPIAHASDGGGSIRIPASCCGLVGLKPTRGRMPAHSNGETPPIELSVPGVLSRTVRDTAAFFAAMEAPRDGVSPMGLVEGPATTRRKIAFFTASPAGTPVDPEVGETIEGAAELCADLGHDVEEVKTPFDAGASEDFLIYWAAGVAQSVAQWEEMAGRPATYTDFEPGTLSLVRHYEVHKALFEKAVHRLSTFGRIYDAAMADRDILLSPVLAAPPPPIGYLRTDIAFEIASERIAAYAPFTPFQNVAGAPAISLPLGMSAAGLPIGAHFAARPGADAILLQLAFEIEEAAPWAGRTPPVWAFG